MIEFEASTSSVQKGETLYDTVLTMSALGVDVAVIRHGDENYYDELIQRKRSNARLSMVVTEVANIQHNAYLI